MANYQYAIFDPRPIPVAQAANDKIFEGAGEVGVLGVEVTVPALAVRGTLGNIDPQHTGGDSSWAAIEVAFECELPPHGATLATVRADLDAVGGMAVIALRRYYHKSGSPSEHDRALCTAVLADLEPRIRLVAESDKFARGGYPGPRSLPSADDPWPEGIASAESSRPLAAIAAAVADFKVPIADRVAAMERWLLKGEEPAEYRSRVEAERLEMIKAIERAEITVGKVVEGLAVVVSTHRAGTSLGYCEAPVVVASNPEFRFQGGSSHLKYTVCQYEAGYVDLKSVAAELSAREPGWGGSPTIIGSPQGQGSTLTIGEVTEVAKRHLIVR